MNELNLNEIVKIEQMPIVFEQLEKIGAYIQEQTSDLEELECTEENKQEVKNRRTTINNTLKVLEDKRKDIKNKLLEPYNVFNEKYEQECKSKLEEASDLLKEKIDFIEDKQKEEKTDELLEFFNQHCSDLHLESMVKFEDVGINITLSASMKSLKEQILDFLQRVSDDLDTILLEDNKDELLLEYKNNGFNYQKAKLTLLERKKQLEELKNQQENRENQQENDKKIEEMVEKIEIPREIVEENEIFEVTFTIKTTKNKIILLKEFLKNEGIEYE